MFFRQKLLHYERVIGQRAVITKVLTINIAYNRDLYIPIFVRYFLNFSTHCWLCVRVWVSYSNIQVWYPTHLVPVVASNAIPQIDLQIDGLFKAEDCWYHLLQVTCNQHGQTAHIRPIWSSSIDARSPATKVFSKTTHKTRTKVCCWLQSWAETKGSIPFFKTDVDERYCVACSRVMTKLPEFNCLASKIQG